jgi:hypothetical protein
MQKDSMPVRALAFSLFHNHGLAAAVFFLGLGSWWRSSAHGPRLGMKSPPMRHALPWPLCFSIPHLFSLPRPCSVEGPKPEMQSQCTTLVRDEASTLSSCASGMFFGPWSIVPTFCPPSFCRFQALLT